MASILIVDDYAVTQRVLGHILQHAGFTVYGAFNGVEALEMLDDVSVDLVISDIAMPEMDGLELLRRIRNHPELGDLPVIMLTASGQDEDRVLAEEAGANGFLTKPASSAELLDAVGNFLG
jgi:CheY-like chemotaxis protein